MALGQHSQQIGNKFPTTNCRSVATLSQHLQHVVRVGTSSTLATCCGNTTCCQSTWAHLLRVLTTVVSVAEGLRVDMRLLLPVLHYMLWICCEFDLRLPLGSIVNSHTLIITTKKLKKLSKLWCYCIYSANQEFLGIEAWLKATTGGLRQDFLPPFVALNILLAGHFRVLHYLSRLLE